ncbi:hypothetical protein CEXT_464591 [Caerostris extrusa]|uniref:Uncharacterized protein n=1 Tax=Caerostris extrusa TaxID=172846 RepID=A0AAV4MI85_CAEEX|nr:hypothetical protein CEXT_464591 [Caerostris extrusa]
MMSQIFITSSTLRCHRCSPYHGAIGTIFNSPWCHRKLKLIYYPTHHSAIRIYYVKIHLSIDVYVQKNTMSWTLYSTYHGIIDIYYPTPPECHRHLLCKIHHGFIGIFYVQHTTVP